MEDTSATVKNTSTRRLNWWKIGFFILLFSLELCREIIVVQLDQKSEPNVTYTFSHKGTLTEATGFWRRTDKKEEMDGVPVTIQCDESRASCILVYLHMKGLRVFPPDVLNLPAKFTKHNITFIDPNEDCVEGSILIDLNNKIARHWHKPTCNSRNGGSEQASYTLGEVDSNLFGNNPTDQHFLPLYSLLDYIFVTS